MQNPVEAQTLWTRANDELNNGNISAYLFTIHELSKFLTQNPIDLSELRKQLSAKEISFNSKMILASIRMSFESLKHDTNLPFEPNLDNLIIQFIGCKEDKAEAVYESYSINEYYSKHMVNILVNILYFYKAKDSNVNSNTLINHLIAQLLKLEKLEKKSKHISYDDIYKILRLTKINSTNNNCEKEKNLAQLLSYDHACLDNNRGRIHRYDASIQSEKYIKLKGDALKTAILRDFKSKLAEAKNEEDLNQIVNRLKKTDEYAVLKRGQDFTTRFFHLKTSSVSAFEQMVKEVELVLQSQPSRPRQK